MAIPIKDADLVAWSTNANTVLVASGVTDYDLTAAEVSGFTGVHTAMVTAYNALTAAREGGTRAQTQTAAKNSAKADLLKIAREIYTTVQANFSVSDELKIALGVRIKASPSPRPAPGQAPKLEVASVFGRQVRVKITDASGARKGKPAVGVVGATLFSFIGENPPSTATGWKCEGTVTKDSILVAFPDDTAPGTKVYFTAYWLNTRGLSSPSCTPVSTHIGFEGSSVAV